MQDRVARIVAYDSVPAPGADIVCTAVMMIMSRDVTLRFDSSGNATIRVVGYRGFGTGQQLDSLDYRVVIAP